jgi:hypothetical protein
MPRKSGLEKMRMSTIFSAHFDGKVLVPDEPVTLPIGAKLEVRVEPANVQESAEVSVAAPLAALAALAGSQPANPNLPDDLAAQHDHYLYGAAKRQ